MRFRENNCSGYSKYDFDLSLSIDYLTTAIQEEQINKKVSQLLSTMITEGMSVDRKIKLIHDWVVKNVKYDRSQVEHSAYAGFFKGTTVCQGYSIMIYKMLKESGVQNRILSSSNHAWNLVNINGKYYHLDATWDDPVPDQGPGRVSYKYYNLSDTELRARDSDNSHVWDASKFPAASSSYDLNNLNRLIDDIDSLSWSTISSQPYNAATRSLNLPGILNNGSTVHWKSTNRAVSSDGTVTRPACGQGNAGGELIATITRGGISEEKRFPITILKSAVPEKYLDWPAKSGVPRNKAWTVKFNMEINPAGISDSIFVATDINGDNKLPGISIEGIPSNAGSALVIKPPAAGWAPGHTYYMFISHLTARI